MEQRFTFDQVASAYGKARPDYPDALVDDVVSYAELKRNDRIFEVGCGAGQATKSFAERGFPILATDPGSEMLRVARESLAGFSNVAFLETTFEAWPIERAAFRLGGTGGGAFAGTAAWVGPAAGGRWRRRGRQSLRCGVRGQRGWLWLRIRREIPPWRLGWRSSLAPAAMAAAAPIWRAYSPIRC